MQTTITAALPRQHSHSVVAHNLEFGVCMSNTLANHRIPRSTIIASEGDNRIEFVLELHLLAQRRDAPLKTE